MRSTKILLTFLVTTCMSFGQHSGGGSGHSGVASPAHPASIRSGGMRSIAVTNRGASRGARILGPGSGRRGFRSGFPNRRRYGTYAPYFPVSGYDYYAPYDSFYGSDIAANGYPEEYPPTGNVVIVQGGPGEGTQPAQPAPVSPVIHEYNFTGEPAHVAGSAPTFTILLKDGSTRSATAGWVQGGKLHYLDLESRQMVLSPEVIDRTATERANAEKSLRLDLPPG
jgi:hypothetical protein